MRVNWSEDGKCVRAALLAGAMMMPLAVLADNAVVVTVKCAETSLIVGQSTTVTIYGEIDAAIEADASQILTWWIDILNDNGGVAAGYGNFQTPASDNLGGTTEGDGTPEGANLRGVYDGFTNNSGAGKGAPVVLAQFEVTALAAGTATFSAVPGTSVDGLLYDFLVPGIESAGPFTGGNYTAASAMITVVEPADPEELEFTLTVTGNQAELSYTPIAGYDHTVQWSPSLQPGSWPW